jgi:hypothetical protein
MCISLLIIFNDFDKPFKLSQRTLAETTGRFPNHEWCEISKNTLASYTALEDVISRIKIYLDMFILSYLQILSWFRETKEDIM